MTRQAATDLRSLLIGGPLPATEVRSTMLQRGHTWNATKEAKKALGVRSARAGSSQAQGWLWHLAVDGACRTCGRPFADDPPEAPRGAEPDVEVRQGADPGAAEVTAANRQPAPGLVAVPGDHRLTAAQLEHLALNPGLDPATLTPPPDIADSSRGVRQCDTCHVSLGSRRPGDPCTQPGCDGLYGPPAG